MNELVSAFRWASAWLLLVGAVGVGCGDVELHNGPRRAPSSAASAAAAPTTTPAAAPAIARNTRARSAAALEADDDADEAAQGDDDRDGEEAGSGPGATARGATVGAATRPAAAGTAESATAPEGANRRAAVSAPLRDPARAARVEGGDGPGPLRSRGFPRVEQPAPRAESEVAAAADERDERTDRASEETTATSGDDVRLRSIVVSRGVENRAPVGSGATFGANEGAPVYTYVEAENAGQEPVTLVFSWRREGGRPVGGQHIEVPAATRRWRTWALTRNARQPGQWTAEVRTASGRLVGSRTFVVAP